VSREVNIQVDRRQVVAFRLARHHLTKRLDAGGLRTAAATAPQNTPPGSAPLALRARADVSGAQVDQAIAGERSLLQVWSLRGSPCIVPTQELPMFTTGLLPDDEASWRAVLVGFLPVIDRLGWTATEVMEMVVDATQDALDGAVLTKRELGTALGRRMPEEFASWFEPGTFSAFSAILTRAASLTGTVTIAPRSGAEASFVRTDQWLGHPVPSQSPSAARAALVRRYLHLYGPSTVEDFAGWAGVAEPFARRAWSAVDDPLAEVDFVWRRGVLLAEDLEALTSGTPPHELRLLPPYEPYLQQRDRTTAVPDTGLHQRIWRHTGNPGVVLHNGEVAALWRQRKKGRELRLTIEPVTPLSTQDRRTIETEAEPLAEFRGCAITEVGYDESR
jgi:Winged helix DNA-binding domain